MPKKNNAPGEALVADVAPDDQATVATAAESDCCPYCRAKLEERFSARDGKYRRYECPRCGQYATTALAPKYQRMMRERQR